jgi:pimeloyl-ACP methyl ester carboxylesterase
LLRMFIAAACVTLVACGAAARPDSGVAGSVPTEAVHDGPQATGVQARHVAGQTFVTWDEQAPAIVAETASIGDIRRLREELSARFRYRVYRSDRPIAALDGMKPIAEIKPLSAWNSELYGRTNDHSLKAVRYVIEEGRETVAPQTAIFVYNPPARGSSYYAVTVASEGRENVRVTPTNVLRTPVDEETGPGAPVLQRIEKPNGFNHVERPTLHYYVRWESSATSSVPGRPFDYVVGIPPQPSTPATVGLHLHAWGANLNYDYGWWYNAAKGALLVATNQEPYDWWTGYHERFEAGRALTPADARAGVVRPYTQRRLLAFLDWVAEKYSVDVSRTFAGGNSMGGSGALMLAIRFPERIAWAVSWVGVHRPAKSPQFVESYEHVYGRREWGAKFEDGTPVWDHFDDAWYLRQRPDKEIGLLVFSNGKNDGAIGWPQAVDFANALQETRRPHVFVWGQTGHGERAHFPAGGGERMLPIDVRTDQTLPAFTHSSLDDELGDGPPESGDPSGQLNLYLYWETEDIVDRADSWEMTVGVMNHENVRQPSATVDITPRRVQQFRPRAGERVTWSNVPLKGGSTIQSGEAVADAWGLVTLERVIISKGKNRIKIARAR